MANPGVSKQPKHAMIVESSYVPRHSDGMGDLAGMSGTPILSYLPSNAKQNQHLWKYSVCYLMYGMVAIIYAVVHVYFTLTNGDNAEFFIYLFCLFFVSYFFFLFFFQSIGVFCDQQRKTVVI